MNPEYDYTEVVTLTAYGHPTQRRPLAEAVAVVMDWHGPSRSSAVIEFKDSRRKDAKEIEEISQRTDFPRNA